MMEIHVIANGEVFREAFNAIVTLLGESTFKTAFRLAVLFAVLGVVVTYIKGRDITVFARWFMLYFVVTVIFLGPKVSVRIYDSSSFGATYTVDNVPYGLAFPASFITSIAYGLEVAVEEAFHMPDDATYSKTGMLFGSRVFGLSTEFHIVDPEIRFDLNQYVKNCVVGDILINKKYSIKELVNTDDIWSLISATPSSVRGIILQNGKFQTCMEATSKLKNTIAKEAENNSFNFYGIRILGGKDKTGAAKYLQQILASAAGYYAGISQSAAQIMTQNIMINGVREGILDYTAEAGAAAALLNVSSNEAMQKMRLNWATSANMATYVLPIMQTDLLLLLLCMFPLVILITLQPGFGYKTFKSYVYSLFWIESWPILFSFLNLAVTFYLHGKTEGLAGGGFTLSNTNQLALEHSDVANMAGYLMTCVPFIAIGIVKGMDSAFSSAAQYIGGMMHSTAGTSAAEVASGNFSLANANHNAVHANNFAAQAQDMSAMSSEAVHSLTNVASEGIFGAELSQNHVAQNLGAANITAHSEPATSSTFLSEANHNNNTSGLSDFVGQSVGTLQGAAEGVIHQGETIVDDSLQDVSSVTKDVDHITHAANLSQVIQGIEDVGGHVGDFANNISKLSSIDKIADTALHGAVDGIVKNGEALVKDATQDVSSVVADADNIGHASSLSQVIHGVQDIGSHVESFSHNIDKLVGTDKIVDKDLHDAVKNSAPSSHLHRPDSAAAATKGNARLFGEEHKALRININSE